VIADRLAATSIFDGGQSADRGVSLRVWMTIMPSGAPRRACSARRVTAQRRTSLPSAIPPGSTKSRCMSMMTSAVVRVELRLHRRSLSCGSSHSPAHLLATLD
jgi:hypothetical protein